MTKKLTKKLISIFLSLLMVLSLIPMGTMTAFAGTEYTITVSSGGVYDIPEGAYSATSEDTIKIRNNTLDDITAFVENWSDTIPLNYYYAWGDTTYTLPPFPAGKHVNGITTNGDSITFTLADDPTVEFIASHFFCSVCKGAGKSFIANYSGDVQDHYMSAHEDDIIAAFDCTHECILANPCGDKNCPNTPKQLGESATYWTLTDGVLTISGTGATPDYSYQNPVPWADKKDAITSVVIENGVTAIGKYFANGCSKVASVTIPNSVTTIGEAAFMYCNALASITLPNNLTTIGKNAFNAVGITSVSVPNTVTSIGSGAFGDCGSLASVTLPTGITEIASYTFQRCGSLTSITIPNGVTSIGSTAFALCGNLASVTFPSSLTTIGTYAFEECVKLDNVTLPEGVTSIGASAFDYCSGLTNVTIPSTVTTIAGAAFRGCSNLTEITLPSSVTTIDTNAFRQCSKLASVVVNATTVPTLGDNVFKDCSSDLVIYVPEESVTDYQASWTAYEDKIEAIPTTPEWFDTIVAKVDASADKLVNEKGETYAEVGGITGAIAQLTNPVYTNEGSVYTIRGYLGASTTNEGELVITLDSNGDVASLAVNSYVIGTKVYSTTYAPHTCTLAKKNGQAATCTKDGWKAYYQCKDKDCGKIYATNNASGTAYADLAAWKASKAGKIAKTGHSYTSAVTKKATYSAEGVRTYTCSKCGNKYTKAIAKLELTSTAKYSNSTNLDASFKAVPTSTGVTVNWGKVAAADGYMIYAGYCGKDKKAQLIKTIKSADTKTYSFTKLDGKNIDQTKNMKVYVVAYSTIDGKKVQVGKTIVAHIIGVKSKSFTNPTKVTVKNSDVALSVGKTSTIKATVTYKDANKKSVSDAHAAEKRYRSSNKAVATVDANGKITAVSKGTCTIYVFAKNGTSAKVTVTVK